VKKVFSGKLFRPKHALNTCYREVAMIDNPRPPTISQALLSLGRINAVENSIAQGISALYRARKVVCSNKKMPNDVKQEVKRFEEFCEQFTKIVSSEDQGFKSIEDWLLEKKKHEITSRLDTFLVIYPLFPNEEGRSERKKWAREFREIVKVAKNARKGQCDEEKIDSAIGMLQELSAETKQLEAEKKLSEQVLSGRTLIT